MFKVYDSGLKRCWDEQIRARGKDSIPLQPNGVNFEIPDYLIQPFIVQNFKIHQMN